MSSQSDELRKKLEEQAAELIADVMIATHGTEQHRPMSVLRGKVADRLLALLTAPRDVEGLEGRFIPTGEAEDAISPRRPGRCPKDAMHRVSSRGLHCHDCGTWIGLPSELEQLRVALQTEREMHNAWRKRAEECEAERLNTQAAFKEAKVLHCTYCDGNHVEANCPNACGADSPKPTSAASCGPSQPETEGEAGWQPVLYGSSSVQASAASPAGARELIAGWIQANPWAEIKVGAYDDLIQRLEAYTRERVEAAEEAATQEIELELNAKAPDFYVSTNKHIGALARAEDAARREELVNLRKAMSGTKEPTMISAWRKAYEMIDARIASLRPAAASKPTEVAS